MDILHNHTYSIEESLCSLVPSTGPMLCRDEIEDWSASEANLFEEALDKYGKDFNDIRQDFVSICDSNYNKTDFNSYFVLLASMENPQTNCRILLHVEDNRSICTTETSESGGC